MPEYLRLYDRIVQKLNLGVMPMIGEPRLRLSVYFWLLRVEAMDVIND